MKVTTGYVVASIRKSIGAGTIHGIEQELSPLFDYYRSPVAAAYCNAFTQQEQRQVEFPFDAEHAIALAASISVAAESGEQAQAIIDEAFDSLRAVMLGEQDAATLTPREQMLCAGFFSLGLKAGMLAGVKQDVLRAKAKKIQQAQRQAGALSKYQAHAARILEKLDAYIRGESKQVVLIEQVREISGHRPSKDTVREWAHKRKSGLPIWQQGE